MIQSKNLSKFLIIFSLLIISLPNFSSMISADYFDNYNAKPLTIDTEGLYEKPSVAVYKNFVHVVWNFWPDEFNCSIYYKKSIDNGKNWQKSVILSSNESTAIYPVIAVNEKIIHVAWKDFKNDNPEIYYVNSYDNGDTWNEVKRITYNSSRKSNIFDIKIAVDNSSVYLTWKDYRSGSSEIFFKKSIDNGETWSEDQRLTFDYQPSYYPDLTVDNNKIFVVYEDRFTNYNIGFLRSFDNGDIWDEKEVITSSDYTSERPDIVISNNVLYLVWQEDISENKIIYFKKSNDYGHTWSEIKQLTLDNYISKNPNIYVYNEYVVILYQKVINNSYFIFYRFSQDFGESWDEEKKLVLNDNCQTVDICGYNNNVHIVWQEFHEATLSDIWYFGNYNISIMPSNSSGVEDYKTPSSGIVILTIAAFISLFIFKKNRLKGDKKWKK